MDPRLVKHYERELGHVRKVAGEFAREFPKIAGRLALDEFECADPYVERLLEGFAYLAARVQLQISAQFPAFTRHLMEMVFPHYLAPIPSMAVVHLQPDLSEGSLNEGFVVDRHTVLRSMLVKGQQTRCVYRTAHDVTLWPLELTEAQYFDRETAAIRLPEMSGIRAGLRIRLRSTAGLTFDQLALDRLPVYLRRFNERSVLLYEQLFASARAVVVRPVRREAAWYEVLPPKSLCRVGFEAEQALFPYDARSFQGYRLLHEYFAMPQRFMFVEFTGLGPSLGRCTENEIELVVLFDRSEPQLVNQLDASDLMLFCTPAVNLFPRRADRIHLSDRAHEHHVVPDRGRPMDFEVFAITRLTGHGAKGESDQEFLPFFTMHDDRSDDERAYYTLRRERRLVSSRQRRVGGRSSYIGSEVFLSLVDAVQAPYRRELHQLTPELLCTNRDLPLHMPVGVGETDFNIDVSAPVGPIKCVAGPTKPKPSLAYAEGQAAWRLVNHLSLNYLTLSDNDQWQGAAALRELLRLYADERDAAIHRQIEGVKSIEAKLQTRQVPGGGPIVFGRALQITVTFDESAFQGTGLFLLGAVLEDFFAKYVSMNSMTETVILSTSRGEVIRWPVRVGRRHTF